MQFLNPADAMLIGRNDEHKWSTAVTKRLTIQRVGNQDFTSVKSWLEFRQREESRDAIPCGKEIPGEGDVIPRIPDRNPGLLQQIGKAHA